jgi:hypothetical protein
MSISPPTRSTDDLGSIFADATVQGTKSVPITYALR